MAEDKDLKDWQGKFENAKNLYADKQNSMEVHTKYYKGTRNVMHDPNSSVAPSKVANNVRNIVFELIESQVDPSIPMPKVRAIHAQDDELAKKIERLLENRVKTCHLAELNDFMERTVPLQGGDYFYVQWDSAAGLHDALGDVKVSEISPKKLIPQPGITELRDMDYFFVQMLMTKKAIKRTYGVDVSEAQNDCTDELSIDGVSENTDLVTVKTAYYKNEDGGIGIFAWCDTFTLLDIADYEARQLDRCSKCGSVMVNGKCPDCGGTKTKKTPEDYEELVDALEVQIDGGGSSQISPYDDQIEPSLDESGNPIIGEDGSPQMSVKREKKKVPYYKPNVFPIVLRRNISEQDSLLGGSDVDVVIDQQDTIKKLGSKINEKLLKGGSYVTLPEGIDVEKSDKELKIIRIKTPADKSLIDVINLQPNVSNDENYLEINYNWAKSSLGITDAYQGKYDASATSGTAKQYSINQAAGRLESKRTLKNQAYAQLYEIMFKFWLAYSDDDTEIISTDTNGQEVHEELNRHDFLKLDRSGELYWDDEFIFETDPTSTLMANREAMWNQTDLKLQSQAFGPLGDLETLRTYWTFMKASGYPNAGMALDIVEQRIQQQQEQQNQMLALQQQQTGGKTDEMPAMPQ